MLLLVVCLLFVVLFFVADAPAGAVAPANEASVGIHHNWSIQRNPSVKAQWAEVRKREKRADFTRSFQRVNGATDMFLATNKKSHVPTRLPVVVW